MSGFLLDTKCISELVRPKPEPRVMEWMEAADEAMLYLSVLTVGEIRKVWLSCPRADGGHIWKLGWALNCKPGSPEESIDAAIADRWGLIAAEAKRRGRTLSVIDGLLAATALHYNL